MSYFIVVYILFVRFINKEFYLTKRSTSLHGAQRGALRCLLTKSMSKS